MLEPVLAAAVKYDMALARTRCLNALMAPRLLAQDPLGAYVVALHHGLADAARCAARHSVLNVAGGECARRQACAAARGSMRLIGLVRALGRTRHRAPGTERAGTSGAFKAVVRGAIVDVCG